MEEVKNNNIRKLEGLALISESLQTLFKGNCSVLIECEKDEYIEMISHFREIDRHHKQFSIDISGIEFFFIMKEEEIEDKS